MPIATETSSASTRGHTMRLNHRGPGRRGIRRCSVVRRSGVHRPLAPADEPADTVRCTGSAWSLPMTPGRRPGACRLAVDPPVAAPSASGRVRRGPASDRPAIWAPRVVQEASRSMSYSTVQVCPSLTAAVDPWTWQPPSCCSKYTTSKPKRAGRCFQAAAGGRTPEGGVALPRLPAPGTPPHAQRP